MADHRRSGHDQVPDHTLTTPVVTTINASVVPLRTATILIFGGNTCNSESAGFTEVASAGGRWQAKTASASSEQASLGKTKIITKSGETDLKKGQPVTTQCITYTDTGSDSLTG